MPSPRIVLDCRWLNSGGAGRITELLLRGLAAGAGEADWVLWGPPAVEQFAWPAAEVAIENHDPRTWRGQRNWLDVPAGDLVLYLHQQRPLRPGPSVMFIHDTIPLHFASTPLDKALKRQFLRAAAALSTRVLAPSEYSRSCILSDLGVPRDKVTVVCCPGDPEMAERVAAVRRALPREPVALYLGLFLPHKNLERLIEAFGATTFRAGGGRLVLMGGTPGEHAALEERLTPAHREFVQTRPFGSQHDLETLLGTCTLLVQPSLEEGFGLPAWEALCCGVPVCASDGGSLPEITQGYAEVFPAASTERMTEALDATAARAASLTPDDAEAASRKFLSSAPNIDQMGEQVLQVLLSSAATQARA